VKRGVMLSGALPLVFPTVSLGEPFCHPTAMFLRNLMAMDTEEMIRAQPMDAVVLIGGCDKTLPAQVMAAVSVDLPAIVLPTGPMVVGHYRGEVLGACTDCRRFWAAHRAEYIDAGEIEQISGRLAPSTGTCGVMGTASTMACLMEALGLALPMTASVPANQADRLRLGESTGRRAAQLAVEGAPRPSDLISESSIRNAMVILQAIGGSTNGLIHLTAIAGRAGIPLDLKQFDELGRRVPVLLNVKPSGAHYMEHFQYAGGMPALLRQVAPHLDLTAAVVGGGTLRDALACGEEAPGQDVIRPLDAPLSSQGAMAILYGNLAPDGAVIKQSAASPALLRHTGRAVVFDSLQDLTRRIDDPGLEVSPDDILVLRNAGPKGAPGMPEAGYLPIPVKLARQGVKDMVRISDARMSGTAFGTIVLHVCPEAAVGGPLALVRTGDRIALDVEARRLDLLVDDAEIQSRRAAWKAFPPDRELPLRGYAKLFEDSVLQANEGCDFDFLLGRKCS
ncbi:MAG TPA: dihydroxy-acid dehydratase, partial [Acidobacteriaceae bacterium]|nr:dihydroxy-acid dehydratase [Acidobacteriaceae bacterium]